MNKVSLIGDEYDVDFSVIKMEQVASHLAGLLHHSKISRSELARELGWKKSRVTKVLSGDENLTIKTITTITHKLGYDFDVIFHNKNYDKPKQPWLIDRERLTSQVIIRDDLPESFQVVLELQSGEDVVDDVLAGKERKYYFSANPSSTVNQANIVSTSNLIDHAVSPININFLRNKEVVTNE